MTTESSGVSGILSGRNCTPPIPSAPWAMPSPLCPVPCALCPLPCSTPPFPNPRPLFRAYNGAFRIGYSQRRDRRLEPRDWRHPQPSDPSLQPPFKELAIMSVSRRTKFILVGAVAAITAVGSWQLHAQAPAGGAQPAAGGGRGAGAPAPPATRCEVCGEPENSAPNPFQTIKNFVKLPAGRKMGSTSAVD